MTATVQANEGARKVTGVVVSNRMDKTVVVLLERRIRHPVYGKYITRSSKFQAHDENNECKQGDRVTIAEVRPLSRRKSWVVLRKEAPLGSNKRLPGRAGVSMESELNGVEDIDSTRADGASAKNKSTHEDASEDKSS